jgi:hypothetical protein
MALPYLGLKLTIHVIKGKSRETVPFTTEYLQRRFQEWNFVLYMKLKAFAHLREIIVKNERSLKTSPTIYVYIKDKSKRSIE